LRRTAINGEITLYFVDDIIAGPKDLTSGVAVTDFGYYRNLPARHPVTGVAAGPFTPELPEKRSAAFIAKIANHKTVAHEIAHVVFDVDANDDHTRHALNVLRAGPEPANTFLKKRFTGNQLGLVLGRSVKYPKPVATTP
jgi:hypothetical protein